jgi:predicted Zn-dependent protease
MEIEQRYVVGYLHRKGMKLPAIVAELAAVYHHEDGHWRKAHEIHQANDPVNVSEAATEIME